ncbi:CPBP family intramembrane glutamic endopeptidase [Natronococcus jeotgali]|uniref:CAAX prenyl protease 2/Lysostaphin resistance protein A-like domain-containing protein n=1 Tax=Natronococcus jeotgali DSM 18795 TaxID=1227498 RepID=L9XM09_9EURY|nr:CPBP family intramembrane glutamic endopeptidase [Natronococcus jeotgali]ELY62436.1 hypothetical protein C492_08090 [Natronococcus jeotgali DSM 18795]
MSRDTSQIRSVLVGIGLAVGGIGVGQLVVLVTSLGLLAIGISVSDSPAIQLGVSTVMVQGVTFGGIALLYLQFSERSLSFIHGRIPTRRDVAWTIGGFLALLATVWTVTMIIERLGTESAQNQIITLAGQEPSVFLLLIVFSFLLVGPGEELLYRGVIQGRLRETFSAPRAVILASALFAAIHGPSLQGDGKWVYIVTVFLLALILGGAYEYTNNIVVPALIHGAYNATIFGAAYISTTQGGDAAVVAPAGGVPFISLIVVAVVITSFRFISVSTVSLDRATIKSVVDLCHTPDFLVRIWKR